MPEAYVEVDGGRLYYDDVGHGPPCRRYKAKPPGKRMKVAALA